MSDRPFRVIGKASVADIVADRQNDIVQLVADTYRLHGEGATTNPDSYFLRFPERPEARIIALPSRLRGSEHIAGIKWISSFPGNHQLGLPRASAVVVLNDMVTGFPFACVEGSLISAARTAASAALAAGLLHDSRHVDRLAVIGAGPIAATVVDFLVATGWKADTVVVHDVMRPAAEAFHDRLREEGHQVEIADDPVRAVDGAGLVLFATTAGEPYLHGPDLFDPGQTVLHVSLRDLGVPVILAAQNVLDDVDHCLKANTSPHLAEQSVSNRSFVAGTIVDLLTGTLRPDRDRPRIFSPFGLGVLDLALAGFVHSQAVARGLGVDVPEFFDTTRNG
jgi:2,3-diaminopropionate biosynthesis protein SbnB